MAIYHLTAKIVSRADGKSSVRSAAYRSGSKLHERIFQPLDQSRASTPSAKSASPSESTPQLSKLPEAEGQGLRPELNEGDPPSARNAVSAAAYRTGTQLHERGTGLTHDYSKKHGVVHTEIFLPPNAPAWMNDREKLWNSVEAVEKRKDAQLAREVEIGLPIELDQQAQIDLTRDYIQNVFVRRGMVADVGIHRDNPGNPHAHILLSTRTVDENGWGPKQRAWNRKSELIAWRREFAEITNHHLANAGLAVRIDHRSYKDQGIELTPGRKIGIGLKEQRLARLSGYLADRVAEQKAIAKENGEKIIAKPQVALQAMTHTQATFTHRDIARFLHTRTEGAEQFEAAFLKVTTSKDLVALGTDDKGLPRFTTREMLDTERSLLARSRALSSSQGHDVTGTHKAAALSGRPLSDEQRKAFDYVVGEGGLKTLVGVAGTGKSTLLSAAREAWEKQGYTVKGTALAGIAAEGLQDSAGIQSRTLASYELAWQNQRDTLSKDDILVIDEAGLVGTRQLERVLEAAERAQAKVVLVGDAEQLQAIEAGAPFRAIATEVGKVELSQVRRQKYEWQRHATQALAERRTGEALAAYERENAVVAVDNRELARRALLARWAKDGQDHPNDSRLILAFTRDDVQQLNHAVRELRKQNGELKDGQAVQTEQGEREFAVGDRLYFLRNDKGLGVKNGSVANLEGMANGILHVRLDRDPSKLILVDTRTYRDLDHGYATTVHKSQGKTVDRTYILATDQFDHNITYVALSRHREAATVFYSRADFGDRLGDDAEAFAATHKRFQAALSRERPQELVHDYLERDGAELEFPSHPTLNNDPADPPDAPSPAERFTARLHQMRGLDPKMPSLIPDHTALPAASSVWTQTTQQNASPAANALSLAQRFQEKVEAARHEALLHWQRKRSKQYDQDNTREKAWEAIARRRLEQERQRTADRDRSNDYGL